MQLCDYGYVPDQIDLAGLPARVTAVHKERYGVVCQHGEVYARLKSSVYYAGGKELFPTVGDFVLLHYVPDGDSLITGTLPRRTYFSRRDPNPNKGEQAVAANFDYVFIMQSMNQDFNPNRLERYLALGWESGATPVIILTKADLVKDPDPFLARVQAVAAGVVVCTVSAQTGEGLDSLMPYLVKGKTAVFLGSSGVGKSSLVNAIAGEELMQTGSIREDDSKGRHTTTHRQLLMLPTGAMVIDTPGMRELGMWEVSQGLAETFSDVEAYLGRCRFRDCAHRSEPGCAIKAAIASGELEEARWQRYCQLKEEADMAEDKAAMLRRKQEWSKGLAKFTKQRKKEIW